MNTTTDKESKNGSTANTSNESGALDRESGE